jgi:hypothetical protein
MDQGTAIADLPDVTTKTAAAKVAPATSEAAPVTYLGALRKVNTASLAQVGAAAFAAQSAPLNVITDRIPFLLALGPTALRCVLTILVFAVLQALWTVR